MVATMHRLAAAMLVLLCCSLFLATLHAQQQLQPATSANTASPQSCIPHERDALLALKHGVTSDPAGLLDSWRRDDDEQDCCLWRGVRCSDQTGHVVALNLRDGDLVGQISPSLLALDFLELLDLSWNALTGPSGHLPEFLGSLKSLGYLDLSSNNLKGNVPYEIGMLSNLTHLDLSRNNLECPTGGLLQLLAPLKSLEYLDLSYNNLKGNVPYEIGMLSNLFFLHLNSNKLDGVITKEHFVNARSLQNIDLSYNALKIEISSDWQPPSKLEYLNFASCQMGPRFPGWLQRHVSIAFLYISSAGIAGRLPEWFADAFSNVWSLDISNNQLNGTLPTDMGSMSLEELYLGSNLLTGPIPTLPPNISNLDLSNNFLSGPLPSDLSNPSYLSLFSNRLTGHIPESFCNKFRMLSVLDLSNNFLVGELPSCLRVMEGLSFLALSNNSLSGKFPSFLQNLTTLRFLDLSWNKFSGILPMWIESLTFLQAIRLSHNNFTGSIPLNITNLSCLMYLDLNNNLISGSLSIHLPNLKSITASHHCSYRDDLLLDYYHDSLSMVWKGRELNYGSIIQILDTSMMSIDLSSNELTGEIPEEIVVDGLVNLDLSRNQLTGVIPKKIGEIQSLQSLDLSRNMLSGEIPATLSNLTFLSYLDLSYNNLKGRVPSGTQLDTLYFEFPSMYFGNIGLCGHPLEYNCSSEGHAPRQGGLGTTEDGYGIQFFYLGLGSGFVVGTWIAFGVLLFKRNWRIAFFRLSDKLCDKVYVLVATWARAREKETD